MKFEFSPYVAVQVKDYAKAIDFYKRVMGMEFIEQKGNDTYLKSGPMSFVFENAPDGKSVFFACLSTTGRPAAGRSSK